MATEQTLNTLIINKVDSKETFNKMKAQGLVNENELYLTPEDVAGTDLSNVVKTTSQELTNDEKQQARTNIGAEASGTAASLMNRTTAVNVADTNYGIVMARGIYAGTTDMTDGVTDLTSGVIYLVYEE